MRSWFDFSVYLGDRILAVNGQSLERVTHEHAVNILKNVTSPVELRVSQSAYNLSSFGELCQTTGLLIISKSELLSLFSLKGSPQLRLKVKGMFIVEGALSLSS